MFKTIGGSELGDRNWQATTQAVLRFVAPGLHGKKSTKRLLNQSNRKWLYGRYPQGDNYGRDGNLNHQCTQRSTRRGVCLRQGTSDRVKVVCEWGCDDLLQIEQ